MAFFQDNLVKAARERQTILDYNEIRNDESGSGISWTICKSFAPYSIQIYRPEALPAA